MVSRNFEFQTKYLECPICHWPHLDKDWFSIHPHKRHLCSGCGNFFNDCELGIGNPVSDLCKVIQCSPRIRSQQSEKVLNINQSDYPEGIQIWGSNPAILWTSSEPEESGIHVHIHSKNSTKTLVEDDTFREVVIDGLKLDPSMVRTFMAQNCLPHLKDRVVSLQCTNCNNLCFDEGTAAFTPATDHTCSKCGDTVKFKYKIKKGCLKPTQAYILYTFIEFM